MCIMCVFVCARTSLLVRQPLRLIIVFIVLHALAARGKWFRNGYTGRYWVPIHDSLFVGLWKCALELQDPYLYCL